MKVHEAIALAQETTMHKDSTPLTFGKYKGKTPDEVSDVDPSYVVWMHDNVKPCPCSRSLRTACAEADCDAEEDRAQALGLDARDGWGDNT